MTMEALVIEFAHRFPLKVVEQSRERLAKVDASIQNVL